LGSNAFGVAAHPVDDVVFICRNTAHVVEARSATTLAFISNVVAGQGSGELGTASHPLGVAVTPDGKTVGITNGFYFRFARHSGTSPYAAQSVSGINVDGKG